MPVRNPKKSALIIRKAVPLDTRVITQFNIELALETEHLRLTPRIVAAGVRAMLKDPRKGIYFVAETSDAGVVGQLMITYEWSDWRNANIWWIQSVYVRKGFRGGGVFKALFADLARRAKKEKVVWSLRLYVEKQNKPAKDTYLKLGMNEMYYDVFEFPLAKAALAKQPVGD